MYIITFRRWLTGLCMRNLSANSIFSSMQIMVRLKLSLHFRLFFCLLVILTMILFCAMKGHVHQGLVLLYFRAGGEKKRPELKRLAK